MAFRKPQQRKQGLKILAYGEDGSGKSRWALTFPKIGFVDTESKVGVYENSSEFGKNLVGVADTTEYYEVIDLAEEVADNPSKYATFVTDSETNLYDSMKVAVMEVEEEKARRFKKNVDDATVSQRGWGKVGLNNARFKNLKAQMSANGITVISIAHKKDVYDKEDNSKKIGEKPDLKEGSKHDYDVVIRFFKEGSGKNTRFFMEIEKDTTGTHRIGEKVENPSYEDWKGYVERSNSFQSVNSEYGKAIKKNMDDAAKENDEDEKMSQVKSVIIELLKELGGSKNEELITLVKTFEPSGNPNKMKDVEKLKELQSKLVEMKNNTNIEKGEN